MRWREQSESVLQQIAAVLDKYKGQAIPFNELKDLYKKLKELERVEFE